MPSQFTPASSQATATRQTGSISGPNIRMLITRIFGIVLSLLIMLALKHHYSQASADQLTWILAPTAKLVAWLTPANPVYESGVGYVDFTQGIIVAPACAGINFMIMAFGLAACCGLAGMSRPLALVIWLITSLCVAYWYTLLVNAVRIGLSMILYRADIYGQWLTAERLHRLTGIGLYLGALWLGFVVLRHMMDRYNGTIESRSGPLRHILPDWLPMVWYLAGAVGVPLANLLFQRQSSAFGEHCITILLSVGCAWGLVRMIQRFGHRHHEPTRRYTLL